MPHANNQSRESILRFVTVSSPMSCPWWVHIVRYFLVCTLRTRHGNRFPIRYVSKDQSNDFNTTKYIDHVSDVNMNTSYIHNFITYLLSRNMSSCSAISDQLPLLYCTKEGGTCVQYVQYPFGVCPPHFDDDGMNIYVLYVSLHRLTTGSQVGRVVFIQTMVCTIVK